jgi:hypothetical protein
VQRGELSGVGLLCAIVYAANAVHYGWVPATRTAIDDILAWATAIVFIGLYWIGYRCVQRLPRLTFRQVFVPAIPLLGISLATIPYDSTDAFLYIAAGRSQSQYGLNPYSHSLRDVPNLSADPIIRPEWMETNKNPWRDLPFVYGFTFANVVKAVAWFGGGNWWFTLLLLKLLNAAAYLLTARLIWLIERVLGRARPELSLYLFAWSPLILQHHIANVHNDLIVGCLVVAAIYLMCAGHELWSPAVLVAASLVKYATFPLVLLSLLFVGRRRGSVGLLNAVLLALFTAGVLSVPYIAEAREFRFALMDAQLNKITAGSLFAFVFYLYRLVSENTLQTFGSVLKIALWMAGTLIVVRALVRFGRKQKPDVTDVVTAGAAMLFGVIFVASSQFYSWYLGMWFPLALLLPVSHWLRVWAVYAGATHVLSLSSLSRKAIGYFVLTSGLASLCVSLRLSGSTHRRDAESAGI